MSFEKLGPVHRGFIAMSGRVPAGAYRFAAEAPTLNFES
jgi:hypothetical protein